MNHRFPIAIENLLPVDIARIINCQLFQKEQFDEVINEINTMDELDDIKISSEFDDFEEEFKLIYKDLFYFLKIYKTPEYHYNSMLLESCLMEDSMINQSKNYYAF